MDPTSLLIAGGMYVAATMAKRVEDEVIAGIWAAMKASWKDKFGKEPSPTELDPRTVESLATGDSLIKQRLVRLGEEIPLLRRAQRAEPVLRKARILWVDDHPEWTQLERQFLEAFGIRIVTVETTRSALACIHGGPFDLIVSDIARGNNALEGVQALPLLRRAAPEAPVIFYVADLRAGGPPATSFGITNKPGELLHLCMDVLERQ